MAIKRSRPDCVIHRRPGVVVINQEWLQARINRGAHTFDTAFTITTPLIFRRGSGHVFRCTITALFDGPAYQYYDPVLGFLVNQADVPELCGLTRSGTTFIRRNERVIFLEQRLEPREVAPRLR